MKKFKALYDGYILGVGETNAEAVNNEIAETEYNNLQDILHNQPTAPDGYGYRLTESLEWELYELPTIEDEAPTAADYEAALAEMGVEV